MKEEWRDVPGLEGCFRVSNKGRMKSKCRADRWQVMRGTVTKDGYRSVHIASKRVRGVIDSGTYRMHRFIAMTFLGPPTPERPYVNHKDGDKLNNHITNLEWCSPLENARHYRELCLKFPPPGAK